MSSFRSHGFLNRSDNMGRVHIDLPINEARKLVRTLNNNEEENTDTQQLKCEILEDLSEYELTLSNLTKQMTNLRFKVSKLSHV